ncbi:MAG TPA: hypothetical protein VFR23_22295 [Jiangellaceae bacterium]|nr:hypothetical protein [Jiangellaceae bacterium]
MDAVLVKNDTTVPVSDLSGVAGSVQLSTLPLPEVCRAQSRGKPGPRPAAVRRLPHPQPPDFACLRQLERGHIEGLLTWNRTRPWCGQRAGAGKGRSVSSAVAQSAVLSLPNMLDDIAAWG